MNKKAQVIGEGVQMIYRMSMVLIVAFAIILNSALVYDFYINTKNSESVMLSNQLMACISNSTKINVDNLLSDNNFQDKLLDSCKISHAERLYVQLSFFDGNMNVLNLRQGDSGKIWVKKIFENVQDKGDIIKYIPGYYNANITSNCIFNGQDKILKVNIEVLIENE